MNLKVILLRKEYKSQFICDMQEAFQEGAISKFGEIDTEILPKSHIEMSLSTKGAVAYEALLNGKSVAGAIVVIEETGNNHLDFLFVKVGVQSKGIGKCMWSSIEKKHPETKTWVTYTPYFEKRNIHFYVNCCGFHIVKFCNKYHIDTKDSEAYNVEESKNEDFEEMFRFEKQIKNMI